MYSYKLIGIRPMNALIKRKEMYILGPFEENVT